MNLSDAAAFARRGAEVIEGLHPGTILIGATEYAVAMASPGLELFAREGGDEYEGELVVTVLKTLMPEKPALRTTITARGRKWAVKLATGDGAVTAVWTLRLEPKQ